MPKSMSKIKVVIIEDQENHTKVQLTRFFFSVSFMS